MSCHDWQKFLDFELSQALTKTSTKTTRERISFTKLDLMLELKFSSHSKWVTEPLRPAAVIILCMSKNHYLHNSMKKFKFRQLNRFMESPPSKTKSFSLKKQTD